MELGYGADYKSVSWLQEAGTDASGTNVTCRVAKDEALSIVEKKLLVNALMRWCYACLRP